LDTGKVSRHKRKEKKNRTKALLRRVKEAASSTPSTSALPQDEQHQQVQEQLLDVAGSQIVPPLRRPIPVTPLTTTIDRVIEIYRGQVRALWKSQGQRPYGRNTELSA
jgi:ABC-type phosphate transport system substrate-binding protein